MSAFVLPPKRRKGVLRTREETDRVMFAVLDDVAAVAQRFGARVVTDAHLPGTVVTELAKRGVHASVRPWNGPAKTAAFQALRARVYSRRIVLPRHPQAHRGTRPRAHEAPARRRGGTR